MSVKVAQLITELDPGGAERVVYDLATGLDPARFEQVVISLRPATGDVAGWLRDAGVAVRSVEMRSMLDLGARRRLEGILRDEGVEMLNTHLIHASLLGRRAAPRAGVRAVVYTVHLAERAWRPWRSLADRLTAGLLDATVCVSESARRRFLRRARARPEKVRVIYDGVDAERFCGPFDKTALRRSLGLSDEDLVIVSLGRLRRQKGHDIALRAMKTIGESEPRARLLIVGDGPEEKRLKKLHSRLGLGECAIFTGQRRDVPEVLAAADCLVAPSRYEGFGLAVAEAMAAGAPVVASRVDSIPEIIEDGVTGLLVPPGDAEALARAVVALLSDIGLARSLGEKARGVVRDKFPLDGMLRAYEALYEEVLRGKGRVG